MFPRKLFTADVLYLSIFLEFLLRRTRFTESKILMIGRMQFETPTGKLTPSLHCVLKLEPEYIKWMGKFTGKNYDKPPSNLPDASWARPGNNPLT